MVEKSRYPVHRVCGEYVSNECVDFLKSEQLYPSEFEPTVIDRFQLTSTTGRSVIMKLDLGGFGISRYAFDNFLYEIAKSVGVEFMLDTEVTSITRTSDNFQVIAGGQTIECALAIGSFGKRSKLDLALGRDFTKKRSPYVGVKYHIRSKHPSNLIALHNFDGGYCGISRVENGVSNLCYLVHRDVLRKCGSIQVLEKEVLTKNPHLRAIFNDSEFLFKAPETINEISFETKEPVWNNMLMAGDAAGMIAPLCGNGMAMAIHSAKIISDLVIDYLNRPGVTHQQLQYRYADEWNRTFAKRLRFGRIVQNKLFGSRWSSRLAIQIALSSKFITDQIIKNTHGKPF